MSEQTPPETATPKAAWWRSTKVRALGAGAIGAVALATFLGFSNRAADAEPVAPERHTPWLEDGVIRYPKHFADREQLAFSNAAEGELTPSLYLTGEVSFDPRRVATVGARINGRLRSLAKVEGEVVAEGEVMAELESVELGKAQAEVLKARAREQVAKTDAERERKLADAKVSAERDAEFAKANADALTAERIAAEKAVEAMGGGWQGEMGVLKLKSPLKGRVVELKARRGQTVAPADTVAVVADVSRVWVEFAVFERDLTAVREGDAVDIKLPTEKVASLKGTVAHVALSLDAETRSGHLRVELENPGDALRIGQSVTGTVHATGPRDRRLTIPKQAVTRIDGVPTVFVKVGEHAVEPRPIKVGPEDGTRVAVLSGLVAGDSVVTQGVLALKAEVFR